MSLKISSTQPANLNMFAQKQRMEGFSRILIERFAQWLYKPQNTAFSEQVIHNPLTIVCISDTHNLQPALPKGDLLLHAGDLTNRGTFAEIQAQLDWLNLQPHHHKVVIAGNHDRLLDAEYTAANLLHEGIPGQTRNDLRWGSIQYLENEAVTLEFNDRGRQLKIYGSPLTINCGNFGFQYPSIRDVWKERIPDDTDIVLTHGPPRGHLDGAAKWGSKGLLQELLRVKPRLCVFGHIHDAMGREDVVLDGPRCAWEQVMMLERGFAPLMQLFGEVMLKSIRKILGIFVNRESTALVNAAINPSVVVL